MVVAKQLTGYLPGNGLYPSFQSANIAKYSVETAFLHVHNDILMAIDNHHRVILVLLDLSVAFDTVAHSTLGCLHTRFGLSGIRSDKVLSLTGRSQSVVFNGSTYPA